MQLGKCAQLPLNLALPLYVYYNITASMWPATRYEEEEEEEEERSREGGDGCLEAAFQFLCAHFMA